MKIVHIEDFFHPDAGYQVNLLAKFMAKKGHKVTVVSSDLSLMPEDLKEFFGSHDLKEKDRNFQKLYQVKIIRVPIRKIISRRAVLSGDFFTVVKDEHPDFVFVHNHDSLTGMRYLLKRKHMPYPFMMDSHMLEMASCNRFHRAFRIFYKAVFTPVIKREQIVVVRTQNNPFVKKCLGVPLKLAPWVSTGSDTTIFKPDCEAGLRFRRRNGIEDDSFVVVYAGKLDETKGGMFLADALMTKLESKRKIIFIIVGTIKGEYGEKLERKFRAGQNQILRFPAQKYVDLPEFFQASDLCIFPRQCSLTFYDAQACALPVLFEDNDVNRTRISNENAKIFKAGSAADFRMRILEYASLNTSDYKRIRNQALKYAGENFDYSSITDRYLEIMNKVIIAYEKQVNLKRGRKNG